MKNGKLIVMEGSTDGVGKSTQVKLLNDRLFSEGQMVVNRHFPSYGKPQGNLVEMYLGGKLGDKKNLSPYEIVSYYGTDRSITWRNELKNEYDKGSIILLDRYTTSSMIYQSAYIDNYSEKKAFIDWVKDYEYNKLGIKEPDEVLYLHLAFDVATRIRNKRKNNEGIVNDIHEADIDFMKRVYESSLMVSEYLNWKKIECSKNDEMLDMNIIHEKVYSFIPKNRD